MYIFLYKSTHYPFPVDVLTFATFLPIIIEEGVATLKGNKYAKRFLSPELAKKISHSSTGAYLGTKVKDSIASRKTSQNAT